MHLYRTFNFQTLPMDFNAMPASGLPPPSTPPVAFHPAETVGKTQEVTRASHQ